MNGNNQQEIGSRTLRKLSVGSIVFGILGGILFWWVPMGMVLAITGLALGFVDIMAARRQSLNFELSIVGMGISFAALVLDIVIAMLGLQMVTFGGM